MRKIFSCLFCLAVLIGAVAAVSAASLTDAVATFAKREQALGRTTYTWDMKRVEKRIASSPEKIADMQKRAAAGLTAIYKSRGVTDEKITQEGIAEVNASLAKNHSGLTYTNNSTWRMSRYDGQTLVAAPRAISDSKIDYRQFYSQDHGIAVADDFFFGAKQERPDNSLAWVSPGDSVRYRCPFIAGHLEAFPEHFAMLMGLNPLAMYGAKWTSASSDASAWVLDTQVEQGSMSPFTIQLTLSRTRDNAPSEIKLTGGTWTEDIRALSFRQCNGEWIPDKVQYVNIRPHLDTTTETFTLQNVSKSGPVGLTPKPREAVIDYRLLGPNLINPHVFISKIDTQQQAQLVTYSWPGEFPSLDQLKDLLKAQHPGEAAPDPDKSASLPVVGGIMALVGAVWMFKRRGGSA